MKPLLARSRFVTLAVLLLLFGPIIVKAVRGSLY